MKTSTCYDPHWLSRTIVNLLKWNVGFYVSANGHKLTDAECRRAAHGASGGRSEESCTKGVFHWSWGQRSIAQWTELLRCIVQNDDWRHWQTSKPFMKWKWDWLHGPMLLNRVRNKTCVQCYEYHRGAEGSTTLIRSLAYKRRQLAFKITEHHRGWVYMALEMNMQIPL